MRADETPVQQLDPGEGKTRHAYLWTYRSNDLDAQPRIVVIDYQTGRAGAHARAFLSGWQGQLMVDDYRLQSHVHCRHPELACMAHIRRKFFDLHAANGSPVAAEALRRIDQLYAIEQQGRELALTARFQLRQIRPSGILTYLADGGAPMPTQIQQRTMQPVQECK